MNVDLMFSKKTDDWSTPKEFYQELNKEFSFDYYILEKCNMDTLLIREQYYIDTMLPEYNINPIVNRPPMSLETRKKQSITRKAKIASGEIPITNNKYVYKYNLDGFYIGEYPSIRKAALANNIDTS